MSMTGERHLACQEDRDCPDRQYCYIVQNAFKHCVKYIVCSNYNRIEAKQLARDPHNCGPCIKGYKTHVFEGGNEVPKCDKEDNDDLTTDIIIYVIVAIILIVFLGVMFIVIYKNFNKIRNYILKRSSRFSTKSIEINQNNTTIANINEDTVVPIASAPEQRPFIEKANSNVSPYNNEMIAQNKFQTATACQAPIWIQNANYGTNITYPSDEIIPENASEENRPIQSSATVNITIEEIPFGPELNIQHDNIMLPSSPTYSPNNSANEDNEADSDANNSASFSKPADINRETVRDKMKNIFINQSVNQLITMNVNLNNES